MIEGLPNWVVFVGGVIGIAIGTAVKWLGQTWGAKIKADGSSDHHVELAGALIDSSVVMRHTAAIEAQTVELIAGRQKHDDHTKSICNRLEQVSDALKSHERAVEDMTKEMIRRR